MKVIYLSQHFPPEIGAAQARAKDMSTHLAKKGHDVTVITAFRNDQPSRRLFQKETKDDVTLHRSFVIKDMKKSTLRRLLNYFSFMLSSIISGLFGKRPDVVFATTPPLFVGVSGYVLSRIRRVKFVIEVRDLWVDFAEVLNQINNKMLLRAARKLEYFLYKKADRIVTVTHGYKDRLVLNGVPAEKIEVITNGVDPTETKLTDKEAETDIRAKYGLLDDFIVLYAGNMGAAQGLGIVLKAAKSLQRKANITFMFVGEGVEKEKLMKQAEEWNLTNVFFIDGRSKEQLRAYYRAADICLVCLKKHPLFDITIPSKLFDCMAMGKPVLLGINGEAKKIVEELDAGFHFQPEDVTSFIERVQFASRNRQYLRDIEANVRSKMLAKYDRTILSAQLEHVLQQALTTAKSKKGDVH